MQREWSIIPSDEIKSVWGFIEDSLQKACIRASNKYSANDFLELLLQGKAQLWVGRRNNIIEASAITDIIQFTIKKYARVTIGMGENPTDLDGFIVKFEEWAKFIGCDGAQSEMRPGFSPQFKKHNWKKTHVLMEKEF